MMFDLPGIIELALSPNMTGFLANSPVRQTSFTAKLDHIAADRSSGDVRNFFGYCTVF